MSDLTVLKGLPLEQGEPVFQEPWQARTFAMCLKLHEAGLFHWQEWAERLASNIAEFERSNVMTSSHDYYSVWQQTLEQLVSERT